MREWRKSYRRSGKLNKIIIIRTGKHFCSREKIVAMNNDLLTDSGSGQSLMKFRSGSMGLNYFLISARSIYQTSASSEAFQLIQSNEKEN